MLAATVEKNGLKTPGCRLACRSGLTMRVSIRVNAIVSVISRPRRCSDESCKRAGGPTRTTGSSLYCDLNAAPSASQAFVSERGMDDANQMLLANAD